jgi:hypothetical protein
MDLNTLDFGLLIQKFLELPDSRPRGSPSASYSLF